MKGKYLQIIPSLPNTFRRHRDSNTGPLAPQSSDLTTRLSAPQWNRTMKRNVDNSASPMYGNAVDAGPAGNGNAIWVHSLVAWHFVICVCTQKYRVTRTSSQHSHHLHGHQLAARKAYIMLYAACDFWSKPTMLPRLRHVHRPPPPRPWLW